jgi:hypothetical protein
MRFQTVLETNGIGDSGTSLIAKYGKDSKRISTKEGFNAEGKELRGKTKRMTGRWFQSTRPTT